MADITAISTDQQQLLLNYPRFSIKQSNVILAAIILILSHSHLVEWV